MFCYEYALVGHGESLTSSEPGAGEPRNVELATTHLQDQYTKQLDTTSKGRNEPNTGGQTHGILIQPQTRNPIANMVHS